MALVQDTSGEEKGKKAFHFVKGGEGFQVLPTCISIFSHKPPPSLFFSTFYPPFSGKWGLWEGGEGERDLNLKQKQTKPLQQIGRGRGEKNPPQIPKRSGSSSLPPPPFSMMVRRRRRRRRKGHPTAIQRGRRNFTGEKEKEGRNLLHIYFQVAKNVATERRGEGEERREGDQNSLKWNCRRHRRCRCRCRCRNPALFAGRRKQVQRIKHIPTRSQLLLLLHIRLLCMHKTYREENCHFWTSVANERRRKREGGSSHGGGGLWQ